MFVKQCSLPRDCLYTCSVQHLNPVLTKPFAAGDYEQTSSHSIVALTFVLFLWYMRCSNRLDPKIINIIIIIAIIPTVTKAGNNSNNKALHGTNVKYL